MPANKLNILCVDDHTLFRKGTAFLLKSFPNVKEVYEAENGLEAVQLVAKLEVDVVLMDLDMPVMNGIEAAKKIISKYPHVYIIIISQHDSLSLISELIEIGVHSYLLKNAEPEEVLRAIDAVISNDFYYNQLVSKALRQKVRNDAISKPWFSESSNLTKREIEIIELICEELTMKEIGEKLYVSEQTVQTHRKNIMKKLALHNGVGLVKYAIQRNIITL